MPRENSFSDSEGRSLTPDLEDDHRFEDENPMPMAVSPTYRTQNPSFPHVIPASTPEARPLLEPATYGSSTMRFRSVVRKVMSMHRSTSMIKLRTGAAGAEPGIDPRRATADLEFSHIQQDCDIQIYDYSSVRSSFGRMGNREFIQLLSNAEASKREAWAKTRWINIAGMDWEVIKAVAIRYNLHPLALEDIFHTRSQTRSKADYYDRHLFLRILCHELGESDPEVFTRPQNFTDLPRTMSPSPFADPGYSGMPVDESTVYGGSASVSRKGTLSQSILPQSRNDLAPPSPLRPPLKRQQTGSTLIGNDMDPREKRMLEEAALRQLKKHKDRVEVRVSPFFIFLLRDGTVISLSPTPSMALTQPITNRLNSRDTLLRTSADPSLLVQSLLDLIVDKALEVIDEYHAMIMKFERQILVKPSVSTVTNLHILSEDLILHKRTLQPIKTLVYGLRRYDLDRCAALVDTSDERRARVPVVGYMTHKSKIYLADVYDHMEYILSSLDMFSGIAENLINYTFNMKSYEMNEVMRLLTTVTIVFMPLTILTGYFGMNFTPFWAVEQNSDLLFWKIALPMMAVVVPLIMFNYFKDIFSSLRKKVIVADTIKEKYGKRPTFPTR